MSRAQRKYRREEKAQRDHSQAVLTKSGTVKLRQRPKINIEEKWPLKQHFACPFCLGLHRFHKYLISTKHGYHQGLVQCPECGNKCRITTLTEIETPEQYAEFAYPYAADGFWQKVPWTKWKERLAQIGWAERFWNRYKELKGDAGEEDYFTHMDREQREWAEEQGLVDEHG